MLCLPSSIVEESHSRMIHEIVKLIRKTVAPIRKIL